MSEERLQRERVKILSKGIVTTSDGLVNEESCLGSGLAGEEEVENAWLWEGLLPSNPTTPKYKLATSTSAVTFVEGKRSADGVVNGLRAGGVIRRRVVVDKADSSHAELSADRHGQTTGRRHTARRMHIYRDSLSTSASTPTPVFFFKLIVFRGRENLDLSKFYI